MHIEQISEVTEELYKAIQSLVAQLGPHKVAPSWEELTRLVSSESSALLIARETYQSGRIVGMLCLTVYRVPTGLRSVIEDVVVDEAARGRGIGAALIREAIDRARAAGAEGVSLTSNPQREAANRLYQSIGFQLRQTNPYFYKLK